MLVDFISKYNCDQLSNTGKDKVSMSSFCHLILGHTNLYLFTSLRSLEVPSYFMGNVGSFGQQGMQGVFTGSSRRCIKMISERNRDNLINIDMGFEQGEEFRLIIFKFFLAI